MSDQDTQAQPETPVAPETPAATEVAPDVAPAVDAPAEQQDLTWTTQYMERDAHTPGVEHRTNDPER